MMVIIMGCSPEINNKPVSRYILVGTANPAPFAKGISEGKTASFNFHSGNFQVDSYTIPLGTEIEDRDSFS
jgi:hypothetical protein